ncbi:hypothetical protein F2Q70_00009390 [Brassica cretica]|uniref:Uncharacterized protein n=1 Tax=Brassica cretica TaxID=69181 RepID=A0A8S9LZF4_BRACR|nr:hypothetical protein F2Q70_00009390 [Brassica cretica]
MLVSFKAPLGVTLAIPWTDMSVNGGWKPLKVNSRFWEECLRDCESMLKKKTMEEMQQLTVDRECEKVFVDVLGVNVGDSPKDFELCVLLAVWWLILHGDSMILWTPLMSQAQCLLPPTGNETRSVAQGDKKRGVPKALIFVAVLAAVGVLFIIFFSYFPKV